MQLVIKAKKNQLKFFGVLKIIAFVLIISYLFYRISKTEDLGWASFQIVNYWTLIIAVALIPLNWLLEFLKWNLTTKAIAEEVSKRIVHNSFFAGMITGLLTPNMIGNFIGRIYYFNRKDRILVTLLTLVSNQAQFLVTLLIGLISIIFLPIEAEGFSLGSAAMIAAVLVSAICLLGYFYFEKVLKIFSRTRKIGSRLEHTFLSLSSFRVKVLTLSFLRYTVFISQFTLVLMAFGVEFAPILVTKIAVVYLVSALIPTLFLGKLGVRESIGVLVLGSIGVPELTVIISSLSVWLLNLILPTLLALILIKSRKD
jgi:uncharacterized membrane protein YbhN (UPF0104 family)